MTSSSIDPWDEPSDEQVAEEVQEDILHGGHLRRLAALRNKLSGLDWAAVSSIRFDSEEDTFEEEVTLQISAPITHVVLQLNMTLNERLQMELQVAEHQPGRATSHLTDAELKELLEEYVKTPPNKDNVNALAG